MRFDVRRVLGDDWAAWRALRLRALQDSPEAFCSTYTGEAAFTEQDWRDRLDRSRCAVLVHAAGEAIGMGAAWSPAPDTVQVVSMWVDPAYRGCGVGRAVLHTLLAWAGDRVVTLEVATSNSGARRLYESLGFTRTGAARPMREGSTTVVEEMVLGGPVAAPGTAGPSGPAAAAAGQGRMRP